MTVFLEECDLPALLEDVTTTVQPLCTKNRNRFNLDLDPAIGVIVTDHRKLRQTLYNLLSNAAKFTQDGNVALRARRLPDDPGRVRFEVLDTGIGMSPDQLERVFHEFSQAEESTSRHFGGTGLGLTLARRFVDLLGGELRVESAPGVGTHFIVDIPVAGVPGELRSY